MYAADAADPSAWSGRAKGSSAFAQELEAGGHGAYAAGSGFASGLTAEQVLRLFLKLEFSNGTMLAGAKGRACVGARGATCFRTQKCRAAHGLRIQSSLFNSQKSAGMTAGGKTWI